MENKVYDELGNEIIVSEDDFKLLEDHQKISDEKFETKTTTFAKDAFKRFCKNKSSVVGAIIIGILLVFALIVPLASPYKIGSSTKPNQALLAPKLFKTGTGFWDGTTHYKNQPYDYLKEEVASSDFEAKHIYNLKVSDTTTINTAVTGAHYGTLIFAQNRTITGSAESNAISYYNYNFISLSSSTPVTMTIDFSNANNIYENYSLGKYRVYIDKYANNATLTDSAENRYYSSTTWSSDYSKIDINLNSILSKSGITDIEKARIGIELLPTTESGRYTYLGINSIVLNTTSTNATEEYKNSLAQISFTDATEQILLQRDSLGVYPASIWVPTAGERKIYQSQIQYASFDYDKYGVKFGDRTMEIAISKIEEYIEKGWLEFDLDSQTGTYDSTGNYIGTISYKILNESKSPVKSIDSIRKISLLLTVDGVRQWVDVITVTGTVTYYKYEGYSSVPNFIFGTTENGYDLFTLAFSSLRTSLLLALLVSAINFSIGLIWGSISGYFGGNIDLVMERITDILSGMPFIVVVTLCILHWGNNIGTFGVALCLTGWIGTAARTRTQFYRYRGREYVLASRTLGASNARLIFKHILPNALGTIVTGAVLMIPGVIFSEATLAYLNLGLQGTASFGVLLSDSQKYLSTLPVMIIFPSIIISLLMISFNLFGNGLRDALNPSLKGSE